MNQLDLLVACLKTRTPAIMWGSPGIGKTANAGAIAKALDAHLETLICSIHEPADLSGYPVPHDGRLAMLAPGFVWRILEACKDAKPGQIKAVLFLDELSNAPPALQAAALRVVLDRYVGDTPLPDACAILAAANPPEQAAAGWDLSAPLANRFAHIKFASDAQAWTKGMRQGWETPHVNGQYDGWEDFLPQARAEIAAFVDHKPHILNRPPNNEAEAGGAWPSPRSWDMASRLHAASKAMGEGIPAAAIVACVGEGAGHEFCTWLKAADLPDPEMLLAKPSSWVIPKRQDIAFAALTSVVACVVHNPTKKRWDAAWQILGATAKDGSRDIAVAAARTGLISQAMFEKLGEKDAKIPRAIFDEFLPILKGANLWKPA